MISVPRPLDAIGEADGNNVGSKVSTKVVIVQTSYFFVAVLKSLWLLLMKGLLKTFLLLCF